MLTYARACTDFSVAEELEVLIHCVDAAHERAIKSYQMLSELSGIRSENSLPEDTEFMNATRQTRYNANARLLRGSRCVLSMAALRSGLNTVSCILAPSKTGSGLMTLSCGSLRPS